MKQKSICLIVIGVLVSATMSGCIEKESALDISVQTVEIKGIVYEPEAQTAAIYSTTIKNTGSSTMHDSIAYLYLIDTHFKTKKHLVLSERAGDIHPNSVITVTWTLDSSSAFAKAWQTRLYEGLRTGGYYTSQPPDILMYVQSKEGVYEVDTRDYTLYYPVFGRNDVVQPAIIKTNVTMVHEIFEDAGIELPKAKKISS